MRVYGWRQRHGDRSGAINRSLVPPCPHHAAIGTTQQWNRDVVCTEIHRYSKNLIGNIPGPVVIVSQSLPYSSTRHERGVAQASLRCDAISLAQHP